jgi:hypothetical protein
VTAITARAYAIWNAADQGELDGFTKQAFADPEYARGK